MQRRKKWLWFTAFNPFTNCAKGKSREKKVFMINWKCSNGTAKRSNNNKIKSFILFDLKNRIDCMSLTWMVYIPSRKYCTHEISAVIPLLLMIFGGLAHFTNAPFSSLLFGRVLRLHSKSLISWFFCGCVVSISYYYLYILSFVFSVFLLSALIGEHCLHCWKWMLGQFVGWGGRRKRREENEPAHNS